LVRELEDVSAFDGYGETVECRLESAVDPACVQLFDPVVMSAPAKRERVNSSTVETGDESYDRFVDDFFVNFHRARSLLVQ